MRKAADVLAAAGFEVKVLWAYGSTWGDPIDQQIIANAKWEADGGAADSDSTEATASAVEPVAPSPSPPPTAEQQAAAAEVAAERAGRANQ